MSKPDFKGALIRKYYIVVGKLTANDPWGVQFGDYSKPVARDELDDMESSGEWYSLRLVGVDHDSQEAIDRKVAELNAKG